MNFDHDLGAIDTIQRIDTTSLPPLGGVAGVLQIIGTGALLLPNGTTAQQPTGVTGYLRFNTQTSNLEVYNGSTWVVSSLNAELSGLSALSVNGLVTRTSAGNYTSRSIAGTATRITVSNGDGVSGNPTIDLATVTQGATGTSFVKVQLDNYGRVINNTPVVAGDITPLVDATYVNVSGDSMASAANLTFSGGGTVTGLPAVTVGSTDATSKAYVDSVAQGLDPKQSVRVATTAAGTLATSFENGDTIDGKTLVTGDRILIKNQGTASENGIYIVAASGAPTRALDMDTWTDVPGAFVFVEEGDTLADTGWVCTSNAGGTLGVTAINFVQFSGSGTYTAGTGLTLTGTQFSLTTPVASTNGGTGLSSLGTANQILGVNSGASGLEYKTVTAGTGVSITHGAGTLTVANTGVTSVAATTSSTGLSITGSPITTTGTFTFSLNAELQGLAGLAATGMVARTGAGTYAARTITGTANTITITNGTGVSGNPTITIADNAILPGTGSVTVVSGTTAQQPTAGAGKLRYDTTTNSLMWSNTTTWAAVGTVTSVAGSGGTTGLTLTGGPITTSGTLTLGGTLALANGGTNASLTASVGGIVYSTASAMAILAGTATANKMLRSSASAAPAWSTATYTDTYSAGTLLYAASANTVSGLALGTANQMLGVNSGATGVEYKTLTAGTGVNITHGVGTITVTNTVAALQLYKENPSAPTTPLVAGTNAVAIGSGSSAPSTNSIALGDGTSAYIAGSKVWANGEFATAGDAQAGMYVMRGITTNATPTELFIDGASVRYVIPNNSLVTFTILVSARRTDTTGGGAGYKFEGVIKKDTTAGSTTIIGIRSRAVLGETNNTWDCDVTADTTNGSLKITVTGEAAKTIRWVAAITTSEVTN